MNLPPAYRPPSPGPQPPGSQPPGYPPPGYPPPGYQPPGGPKASSPVPWIIGASVFLLAFIGVAAQSLGSEPVAQPVTIVTATESVTAFLPPATSPLVEVTSSPPQAAEQAPASTTQPATSAAPAATRQTTARTTTAKTTQATRAKTTAAAKTQAPLKTQARSDVYYENCTAARAAGAAPIRRGEPGYRGPLDRDDDGIACE